MFASCKIPGSSETIDVLLVLPVTLGQPFWFYATWKAGQWGIFALCTLYTYAWARGVWTHWLSPYYHARRLTGVQRWTPAPKSMADH